MRIRPEKQMAAIVAKHLHKIKYRLFLFGSRARREHTVRSNYDLAISSQKPVPLSTLALIRGDLETLPLLQKIDLVDMKYASSSLKSQILKHGILLSEH